MSTRDSSPTSLFVEDQAIPLQLPEQSSYTTHRTVTPVLPEPKKTSSSASGSEWDSVSRKGQSCELFSPMPTQFLVPPDYEAVFSGHQTLRVSDTLQASNDPVSVQILPGASIEEERSSPEDFSPKFSRVLSGTDEPFEDIAKHLQKEADSPGLSDSDLEFFDCRQGFSDLDPEDACCRISEPPSPMPGSAPDNGILKSRHSESLGEFVYDCEANVPVCEELPSRDQAGYWDDDDDDDFLGRVSGKA